MEAMIKQIQNERKMNQQAILAAKQKLAVLEGKEVEFQKIEQQLQNITTISTSQDVEPAAPAAPQQTTPKAQQSTIAKIPAPRWSDMTEDQPTERKTKDATYVIFDGPFKGLYKDWHIVSSHVSGKPYAHKKYTTRHEAEQALKASYKTLLINEPEPKKKTLPMRKIPTLNTIQTTAERLALKKLTVEKMQTMEKMLTGYSEVNTTMQYYPRNTRNGVRAIILPGAESLLVSDFYQCGLIDTLYIQGQTVISELPQGVQTAIRSFNKFANRREIFMKFNSSLAAIIDDNKTEETPQLIQIGVSNGNYPTRDEEIEEISGDDWYESIGSIYFRINQINKEVKTKRYRVNYFKKYTLIYSLSIKETSKTDTELFKSFEDIINRLEPYEHLTEDLKKTLCSDFQQNEGHRCKMCKKSQEAENNTADITTTQTSTSEKTADSPM